jgi:hypothetical protein
MAANTGKTAKKRGSGKPWPKGQSGNPAGRPKDGESWAAIIAAVGNMYPADILAFVGKNNDLGKVLAQLPQDVQMKYLVTARVFAALMFEPSSGLWKELMERAEGKVSDKVELSNPDGSLTQKLPDEERLNRMKELAAAIAQEIKKDA